MTTWFNEGLVHGFSHINRERRAGRTFCGQYVEFWPKDLVEDCVVTCLGCVSQPRPRPEEFDNPSAIQERWEDRVRECGENRHNLERDKLGNCVHCGYGQPLSDALGYT